MAALNDAASMGAWHRSKWLGYLYVSAAVLFATAAQAHKPSDSYLTLNAQGTQVFVRWDVALRDLDPELGLDINDDGQLSWGEVRTRARDIAAFVMPQLSLSADRGLCTLTSMQLADSTPTSAPSSGDSASQLADPESIPTVAAGVDVQMSLVAHSDGTYAVLQYRLDCGAIGDALTVDYHLFSATDPTHRGIVRVARIRSGSNLVSIGSLAVLGPGSARHVFSMSNSSKLATFISFVVEGIWHIWLGFDHVLFLLTLLLPSVLLATGPRGGSRAGLAITSLDVLRIVTAFTLAHSLTLTLAVLDWVSLPTRLVESGIALTVLLGALNNLHPVLRERRWIAAFMFGLIHGFGFAGALKALNLQPGDLALSLFGFNVGVEIGQLVIVAAFVPLAFRLRNTDFYRRGVLTGGSIVIAIVAATWFVERAWDIKLLTL